MAIDMTKAPSPPEFSTRRGTGAVAVFGVDGRTPRAPLPAATRQVQN